MKVNKTQAVLCIYNLLITKGYISKSEVSELIEINNLTFLRYIKELRDFLAKYKPEYDLAYLSNPSRYTLLKKEK